jgi:hypothetical protein
MNKWAKLLIISLIGFFLLGGIGSYGILEATGEEVVARGDASEEISFKGDWDQFYDIYAEDQSIEISFQASESYDPDYTYILRCEEDGGDIGFSGDCLDKFENAYLVADFTVEAGGVGDVTLSFDGTGEVIIVKSSAGAAFAWIMVLCSGCCLCPIGMIISGVKLSKGKENTVLIMHESQPYPAAPAPVVANRVHSSSTINSQPSKQYMQWDNDFTQNLPSVETPPTHVDGGYEWLNHNGKMFYRTTNSNLQWTEFKG